jgi:hypothetical protein
MLLKGFRNPNPAAVALRNPFIWLFAAFENPFMMALPAFKSLRSRTPQPLFLKSGKLINVLIEVQKKVYLFLKQTRQNLKTTSGHI